MCWPLKHGRRHERESRRGVAQCETVSVSYAKMKTLKTIDAVERTVKNTMRKLAKCIRLIQ
jgi:hypothetical protein